MPRSQIWQQSTPEEFELFGESLSAGDFDGDGIWDLAIASSGEDIGEISSAGAVNIVYGSDTGLTAIGNQIWHQDSLGIIGYAEEFDFFGESLTAGDFNGDGIEDLVVGSRLEDIGEISGGGAVNVIYGSDTGLTATDNQIWHQDIPGIIGDVQEFDFFSESLVVGDFNGDGIEDLAIAASGEDIGDIKNAGAVNVIYGSNTGLTATDNQIWHQDTPEIIGDAEKLDFFGESLSAGDFNGDGIEDLAVGSLLEDVGDIEDAGAVNVIYGSDAGLTATDNQIWHQDSLGIIGDAEKSDRFGFSLTAGDYNGDGIGDLAVAASDEDVGDIENAGAVNVIYGSDTGLTAIDNQIWHQNSPGITGDAEKSDRFGASGLTTEDFNQDGIDDLAASSFLESIGDIKGAGTTNIIYGSDSGLSAF